MFSKELELSIASLFDKAHEANIQYITVEHLLLMILSDYEVKEFFKSEGIQLESIKQDLNEHLKDSIVKKIDQQKPVQPLLDFKEFFKEQFFTFNLQVKVLSNQSTFLSQYSLKKSRIQYLF